MGPPMMTKIGFWAVCLVFLLIGQAKADFFDSIVFISTSLEYEDGRPAKILGTGTGFVVNKAGLVVTAKHVIPTEIPAGARLVLKGSLRTRDKLTTLIPFQTVPLGVDISVLRFDPLAQPAWEYLKLSPKVISDLKLGDAVVAWGFALDEGLNRAETKISSLVGPENTVQVGAGLVKGMSGGPVIDTDGNVVGVITGGAAGQPALTYFTPISFANPVLRDYAEYATVKAGAGDQSKSPKNQPGEPIAKNYDVAENRSIGALASKEFSITREAETGRKITQARLATTTILNVSNISVSIAKDGSAVTLTYVVTGDANGGSVRSGTLIGSILTEQQ